jgi:hypothetical protein
MNLIPLVSVMIIKTNRMSLILFLLFYSIFSLETRWEKTPDKMGKNAGKEKERALFGVRSANI